MTEPREGPDPSRVPEPAGSLDAPGPSRVPEPAGSLDAPGPSVVPEPAGSLDAPPSPAPHTPRTTQGETPLYKGEPLDSERGPGLGCFWVQITLLIVLLVLTPLTVVWAWDERISAVLLIVTLILLLFAGQTVIFLLRLVAADRRSRRVPRSSAARRTVGMLEDEAGPTPAETRDEPPAADETRPDRDP